MKDGPRRSIYFPEIKVDLWVMWRRGYVQWHRYDKLQGIGIGKIQYNNIAYLQHFYLQCLKKRYIGNAPTLATLSKRCNQ
ncbi:hypothetical protein FRX31_023780 [Thalictrum thalictroides]|uniref:Uncharacterized protein n=1 Tax=Thalictrum thalictroides TaxID=46969 RepID=A0A7J6VPD9_THATH|nr:hypothetical protein FRX31_023780 [Thalictrum thalictroides]